MRERRTHGSVRGLRREPLVYSTVILPFSFIKKMSNRGTVTGAVLFKICGLSMISERKNGYENRHNMF